MESHREPESIASALSRLKSDAKRRPALVPNWKDHLPEGTRWQPGDIGDPACPECKGVGYVRVEVEPGHPMFGKLFVCDCAEARVRAARIATLQKASALSARDLALRWSDVQLHDTIREAVQSVRQTLAAGWGWVYLWGGPGPGKTLILKTALAECIEQSADAVYANWADLLQHLRAGYDSRDYDERVERWRAVKVLAVDEFGRAKESEWAREAQARIFNARYESALDGKTVTLFASNYPPERADEWFADRVRDGRFQVVEIKAPSMRPMMERQP